MPQVLLVLDPNGLHCWEDVTIDDFINKTLLAWLHKQTDAMTVGSVPGSGLPLQVCCLTLVLDGTNCSVWFSRTCSLLFQPLMHASSDN